MKQRALKVVSGWVGGLHLATRTHDPTTPQPHDPTTPRPHEPTTPRPHDPTTPRPHDPTTLRTHEPTTPHSHEPTEHDGEEYVEQYDKHNHGEEEKIEVGSHRCDLESWWAGRVVGVVGVVGVGGVGGFGGVGGHIPPSPPHTPHYYCCCRKTALCHSPQPPSHATTRRRSCDPSTSSETFAERTTDL